ncbi:MAG: hypothetical protein ACFBZ8_00045 [Opitutales bacterium]
MKQSCSKYLLSSFVLSVAVFSSIASNCYAESKSPNPDSEAQDQIIQTAEALRLSLQLSDYEAVQNLMVPQWPVEILTDYFENEDVRWYLPRIRDTRFFTYVGQRDAYAMLTSDGNKRIPLLLQKREGQWKILASLRHVEETTSPDFLTSELLGTFMQIRGGPAPLPETLDKPESKPLVTLALAMQAAWQDKDYDAASTLLTSHWPPDMLAFYRKLLVETNSNDGLGFLLEANAPVYVGIDEPWAMVGFLPEGETNLQKMRALTCYKTTEGWTVFADLGNLERLLAKSEAVGPLFKKADDIAQQTSTEATEAVALNSTNLPAVYSSGILPDKSMMVLLLEANNSFKKGHLTRDSIKDYESGTWQLQGMELLLTTDNGKTPATIIEFSGLGMSVRFSDDDPVFLSRHRDTAAGLLRNRLEEHPSED